MLKTTLLRKLAQTGNGWLCRLVWKLLWMLKAISFSSRGRILVCFCGLSLLAAAALAQIDTSVADRLRDRIGDITSLEVEYTTTSTEVGGSGRAVAILLAGAVDVQTSSGW